MAGELEALIGGILLVPLIIALIVSIMMLVAFVRMGRGLMLMGEAMPGPGGHVDSMARIAKALEGLKFEVPIPPQSAPLAAPEPVTKKDAKLKEALATAELRRDEALEELAIARAAEAAAREAEVEAINAGARVRMQLESLMPKNQESVAPQGGLAPGYIVAYVAFGVLALGLIITIAILLN